MKALNPDSMEIGRKHMFYFLIASPCLYLPLMTYNDFDTENIWTMLYAYLMKALNPNNMKIGRKHIFYFLIASPCLALPLMTSNDFKIENI